MELVCDKALDHVSNKKSLQAQDLPIRHMVIEQDLIQFRKIANPWQGEVLAKQPTALCKLF